MSNEKNEIQIKAYGEMRHEKPVQSKEEET